MKRTRSLNKKVIRELQEAIYFIFQKIEECNMLNAEENKKYWENELKEIEKDTGMSIKEILNQNL